MQIANIVSLLIVALSASATAKQVKQDACVSGITTIASQCEQCARWGIECLRYESYKSACNGGPNSPHSKACNACVDNLVKIWE